MKEPILVVEVEVEAVLMQVINTLYDRALTNKALW